MVNEDYIEKEIMGGFSFLCSDFGGKLISKERDSFGVFLTYATSHAGVRVSFEPRENGIFVMIFPLEDGKVPAYSKWNDVVDLLAIKGISFSEKKIDNLQNPDRKDLREAIEHYAKAVEVYAKDYLDGDFSLLRDLKGIVAKRAKELNRK